MLSEEYPFHVLIDCEKLLELRVDILGADAGVNINIMEIGQPRRQASRHYLEHELSLITEHPIKHNNINYLLLLFINNTFLFLGHIWLLTNYVNSDSIFRT